MFCEEVSASADLDEGDFSSELPERNRNPWATHPRRVIYGAAQVREALHARAWRRDQNDLRASAPKVNEQVTASSFSHEVEPSDDVKGGTTLVAALYQERCSAASASTQLSHVIHDPHMGVG